VEPGIVEARFPARVGFGGIEVVDPEEHSELVADSQKWVHRQDCVVLNRAYFETRGEIGSVGHGWLLSKVAADGTEDTVLGHQISAFHALRLEPENLSKEERTSPRRRRGIERCSERVLLGTEGGKQRAWVCAR
jgi:hypothetical protein